jgi:hypothetical protein
MKRTGTALAVPVTMRSGSGSGLPAMRAARADFDGLRERLSEGP